MTNGAGDVVPVWTIATESTDLPAILDQPSLTPGALEGLRGALAAMSTVPIATLEAHSMPKDVDRSLGIRLDGVSPLAQQLSQLVKSTPSVVSDGGETLYRMVVPAKVAEVSPE